MLKRATFPLLVLCFAAGLVAMPTYAQDSSWCLDCHLPENNDCAHLIRIGICPAEKKEGSLPPIVTHSATPVRVFEAEEGLDFYFVGDGASYAAGRLPTVGSLSSRYPPGTPVLVLEESWNPATEQPVMIRWLPDEQRIEVSTAYASGKAYKFQLDAENKVTYVAW